MNAPHQATSYPTARYSETGRDWPHGPALARSLPILGIGRAGCLFIRGRSWLLLVDLRDTIGRVRMAVVWNNQIGVKVAP